MANAWIQHIKDFAKKKGLTYCGALSDPECSRSYHKKKTSGKGIFASKPKANASLPPQEEEKEDFPSQAEEEEEEKEYIPPPQNLSEQHLNKKISDYVPLPLTKTHPKTLQNKEDIEIRKAILQL